MKVFFIPLLICSLVLVACGPKINDNQQKQLKKLTEQVDSITKTINAIDSAKLITMTSNFFERKEYVQNNLVDTVDKKTLFKLDDFIQLRKGMGYLATEYSSVKSETNIMSQQIEDLNHDVDKGLIEEKQFNRYIGLELENFKQLQPAAGRLIAINENMKNQYNSKVGLVDSLIAANKTKLND